MTPRCVCCGRPLSPGKKQFDGWCVDCAGKTLHAALALRDGTPAQVGAVVAWLQDNNVPFLAYIAMGVIPDQTCAGLIEEGDL